MKSTIGAEVLCVNSAVNKESEFVFNHKCMRVKSEMFRTVPEKNIRPVIDNGIVIGFFRMPPAVYPLLGLVQYYFPPPESK